ncbi:arsenate reductase ArsC [Yinghuangia sp. ASG 101]|uniref:arsenate reductase ArsC n=1 Tax=Yinghuangia sp. ASG 101 TaxID=2896848 RepID=UPI001E4C9943|nr:arsenate reductase ArsC [Yinghuangia sp. ASG 101]UGQ10472.1 arsenate reductase ArsC [Yinghuangia sp. ASG 101]
MASADNGTPPGGADPEIALGRIGGSLAAKFHGVFSAQTVARYLRESHALLAERATIQQYLPILAGRFTAERLSALARAEGLVAATHPEILFVCEANAGRSQIAAALLKRYAGDTVVVRSAGSRPASELELTLVEVMSEIGVDLDEAYPKPLTDEVVRAADVVVTLGCGDACPVLPGRRYLDWTVPDPSGRSRLEIRRIRDEIDLLVTDFLVELGLVSTG